jgi:carnitine O-acetyltransferase
MPFSRPASHPRVDLDRTAPSNWLDDSLWLRVAYHSSRTPLPIHSNWWLLAAPDATLEATTGQSDAQLARAAHLVNRFLEFKTRIDRYVADAGVLCWNKHL